MRVLWLVGVARAFAPARDGAAFDAASAAAAAAARVGPLGDWAWSFVSQFDYTNSSNDVLAVAYPAAVATYFISYLAAGSQYAFNGTFLDGPGVFQCSLMVYDAAGDLDESTRPRYGVTGPDVRLSVAASPRPRWALQRFYVMPEVYSRGDLEAALVDVRRDGRLLPLLGDEARLRNSRAVEGAAAAVIGRISGAGWPPLATPFHFKGGDTGHLFPDYSHVYAVAYPVASKSAVITGHFDPSDVYPYLDFSIGNQSTTEVDDAIPFYTLRSRTDYCLEVLAPECPASPAPAMRWAPANAKPLLMARLIAYDYVDTDYRRWRTPAGTRSLLGDAYPEIAFAADCSARCP